MPQAIAVSSAGSAVVSPTAAPVPPVPDAGTAAPLGAVPPAAPPTAFQPAATAANAAAAPAPAGAEPGPGFSVAPVAAGDGPASAAASPGRSLAAIMASIEVPEEERVASVEPVDLTAVARLQNQRRAAEEAAAAKSRREADAKAKAKAEADAKAKAEAAAKALLKANPSRNWVQVATGRDAGALAFDLRRLKKTYAPLADQDGWTAEWGATRRLLVGPFAKAEDARALQNALRKAGADSFVWQSEAGEVVTALSRK